MTEQQLKAMAEIDEAAERAGGFVDFTKNTEIHYDYRKILKYCKEKGIEPVDMTIRELNNFIIR